jgi:hypothetical protein
MSVCVLNLWIRTVVVQPAGRDSEGAADTLATRLLFGVTYVREVNSSAFPRYPWSASRGLPFCLAPYRAPSLRPEPRGRVTGPTCTLRGSPPGASVTGIAHAGIPIGNTLGNTFVLMSHHTCTHRQQLLVRDGFIRHRIWRSPPTPGSVVSSSSSTRTEPSCTRPSSHCSFMRRPTSNPSTCTLRPACAAKYSTATRAAKSDMKSM